MQVSGTTKGRLLRTVHDKSNFQQPWSTSESLHWSAFRCLTPLLLPGLSITIQLLTLARSHHQLAFSDSWKSGKRIEWQWGCGKTGAKPTAGDFPMSQEGACGWGADSLTHEQVVWSYWTQQHWECKTIFFFQFFYAPAHWQHISFYIYTLGL